MLENIKNRVISVLQLIVVVVYIIFEELIWESIASPIYKAIQKLEILKKLEEKLKGANAQVILFIFLLLFISVESLGVYAGILFVSGQVFIAVVIYLTKIPIAAFTFWLFRVSEDKLMEFDWFRKSYILLLKLIDKLKATNIYKKTIKVLKEVKQKYFSKKSEFIKKLKSLYKSIKVRIDR